jgi:holo-[acyl-carrier protein] synthase
VTIIGVGIDVVDTERMRTVLARTPTFADRVFTEGEREYCRRKRDPSEGFAARFAAKEAVLKALDESILRVPLKQIEVVRSESGKPFVVLRDKAAARADELGITDWQISMTHTALVAQAIAVASGA